MNKKYIEPELKVSLFESIDVITASGEDDYFDNDMVVNNNITGVNK